MDGPNFLSREDIDGILRAMTARDIFRAVPDAGDDMRGAETAGKAFEKAAERQGYGTDVLDRIRPRDAIYLAQELSEVFTQDSPKGDSTGEQPDSSDTGESTPSSS